MNEFSALQAKARESRDRAIKLARSEYRQTIEQLAELKTKLFPPRQRQRVARFIESAIPENQEFTRSDLLTTLRATAPNRIWSSETVKRHLTRMQHRGLIRKLRTLWRSGPAVYVLNGGAIQPPPTPLGDVIAELLAEQPMTEIEIAVAFVEAGHEKTSHKALLRRIRSELRRDRRRFNSQGKTWQLMATTHVN